MKKKGPAMELTRKIKSLGSSVAESDKFRVAVLEIINDRLAEQGDLAVTAAEKQEQASDSRKRKVCR